MHVCPRSSLRKLAGLPPVTPVLSGRMKTMFWLYLIVVWSGIVYFSVIGLTHH
ncbi:MAG: hypothetical protein QOC95_353 [Thermoleophilaceae bacterium]|nr:hypothetical protein [Thermoleophilaceae bacterium]